MKAVQFPDGRIEFVGTPEEIARLIPQRDGLPPRKAGHITQERQVFEILCTNPGKAFNIDEILTLIGGHPYRPSYSMALSKLAREGIIDHPRRGLYQYRATNLNQPPRPGVNGSRVSRSHPR